MNKQAINLKIRTPKNKHYSIEEVHALFDEWDKIGIFKERKSKKINVMFDGYLVKTYSQRYELFRKNYTCVCCGLKANCYILEKQQSSKAWHFNLYHIDENGKETLFTKDHVIAKANGGDNTLSNYQTMCCVCNGRKGCSDKRYLL